MLKKTFKYLTLGNIGGVVYILLELIYRQYTHWSMYLLAFLVFIILGGINEFFTWEMPMWKQCLIGAIIVTILEFITGCIVNLWLGWNVWHYDQFDVLGQICLPYSLLWFLLSGVAIVVDDWLRYLLFDEEKPHYKWL